MARAARLLDESGEHGVERGYLLMPAAHQSMMSGNMEEAESRFAEAADIGARFGDADLTSLARQSRGREWTEALTRWCDSQPDMVPYRGECLVHRAEIISLRGVWPDALNEALLACERLSEPPGQPRSVRRSIRSGSFTGCAASSKRRKPYRKAAESGRSPYPGLALLRLAQGRRDDASAAICRVLQEARHRRVRSRVLSAAVEIMLSCDDISAARQAADELNALAQALGTPFMRATAAQALGAVLLAEGDPTAALAECRTAFTLWRELNVPYESARTQVLIAQACRALHDRDSADFERDSACRTFEQLGARLDLARLQTSGAASRSVAGLTARELEVLRLVATGRTNRAIADDLDLSEKTVARHIANIFNKLDVSSRAAATAYAFEHHLVESPT